MRRTDTMKRTIIALSSVLVGFTVGASAAWAHGPNGHGKSTAEQCKRILDPEVQAECLRCIDTPDHAFFPGAKGEHRCAETHHDHD